MRKYREIYYFLVPISKELNNGKTIMCRLKFIYSFRFMSTSLSSHRMREKKNQIRMQFYWAQK